MHHILIMKSTPGRHQVESATVFFNFMTIIQKILQKCDFFKSDISFVVSTHSSMFISKTLSFQHFKVTKLEFSISHESSR